MIENERQKDYLSPKSMLIGLLNLVCFSFRIILDMNLQEEKWVTLTVRPCQEKPMLRDIPNSQSFHH